MSEKNMEEEFLTCYICYDVFKEPKTLSCLHRFCEQCLHNYLLGQKSSSLCKQGGFQCPVCREFMKSPNPKRHPSDWASLLKTDFHLKNLIRFVESSSDFRNPKSVVKKNSYPCSIHKEKDRDLFCVDCNKIICHQCAGISHRGCNSVMTVTDLANGRRAVVRNVLESVSSKIKEASNLEKTREKCLNHLERQRKDVEQAIRKQVAEVLKVVHRAEEEALIRLSDEYETIQGNVVAKLIRYKDTINKAKEEIKSITTFTETSSNYDLLSNDKSVDLLDRLKEEIDIKAYTEQMRSVSNVKIEFVAADVPEIHLGKISLTLETRETTPMPGQSLTGEKTSLLDRIRGRTSRQQHITESTDISDSTIIESQRLSRSCSVGEKPTVPRKMSQGLNEEQIRLDQNALSLVRSCSASNNVLRPALSLSKRTVPPPIDPSADDNSSSDSSSSSVNDNLQGAQSCPNDNKSSVTILRTVKTSFREDDCDPKLRDLVVMKTTNTILATDWANHCVKAFFVRRDKDCRVSVGGKPWAITLLPDGLAAASLPLSQQICILKISPRLMVQKCFLSPKKYTGLASLNSSMLVASGGSEPPCVDIINLYGEVIKSFSMDAEGQPLFVYPAYVSVTPALSVLVSDRKQGAVFGLSHTGGIRFRFCPEASRRLQSPSGVIATDSGEVLVAESRGILSLFSKGEVHRPLVRPSDGVLSDPRGLALDSEGLLYVTSNDDLILVLRVG